jgi:hypothetical protein
MRSKRVEFSNQQYKEEKDKESTEFNLRYFCGEKVVQPASSSREIASSQRNPSLTAEQELDTYGSLDIIDTQILQIHKLKNLLHSFVQLQKRKNKKTTHLLEKRMVKFVLFSTEKLSRQHKDCVSKYFHKFAYLLKLIFL